MDTKDFKGLIEAYSSVYDSEQLDEITADLAMKATKSAEEKRRVASLSGDKETASSKAAQASRIYSKVGKLRAKERKVQLNNEVEHEIDEATAMAKRGYDEAPIRQKIAKSTGGGAAADRATKLENQPTYGDTNKAKQRQNLARKQRGDFRKTTSSSPGLHGYAHKSDDPKVKAKQAARGAQRGALTSAEKKQLNMGDESFDIFDTILEFLCVEGYAETLEDAEWMMANLIDEEAIAIILEASSKEKEEDEEEDGEEDDKKKMKSEKKGKKDKEEEEEDEEEDEALKKEEFSAWIGEAMSSYEKNRKRAAARAEARNAARDAGKTGVVPGVGYVSPRREKISLRDKFGDAAGTRMAKAKPPSGDEKH